MTETAKPGVDASATFTLPGTDVALKRMGYGAMQLAGPGAWGPPRDPAAAAAVLRKAVKAGVNHIDTSDYYGPHFTNQIIREALRPYPDDLTIVTKVGYRRGTDRSWVPATSPADLNGAVHDNLRNLGLSVLDVVNLRLGSPDDEVEPPLSVLADLKRQGLIRHIGLSNITPRQFAAGQSVTDIVCVQNHYNLVHRTIRRRDRSLRDFVRRTRPQPELARVAATEATRAWLVRATHSP